MTGIDPNLQNETEEPASEVKDTGSSFSSGRVGRSPTEEKTKTASEPSSTIPSQALNACIMQLDGQGAIHGVRKDLAPGPRFNKLDPLDQRKVLEAYSSGRCGSSGPAASIAIPLPPAKANPGTTVPALPTTLSPDASEKLKLQVGGLGWAIRLPDTPEQRIRRAIEAARKEIIGEMKGLMSEQQARLEALLKKQEELNLLVEVSGLHDGLQFGLAGVMLSQVRGLEGKLIGGKFKTNLVQAINELLDNRRTERVRPLVKGWLMKKLDVKEFRAIMPLIEEGLAAEELVEKARESKDPTQFSDAKKAVKVFRDKVAAVLTVEPTQENLEDLRVQLIKKS